MEASERASPEPRRSVQTGATCPPPPASGLGTVAGTSQRGRRRSRGHPASSQEAGRASRRLVTSCAVSRPRVVKPRSRAAVWRVFGDRALAWRCVGECQGGRASVVRGPRLLRRRAGAVVPGATPPPRARAPRPRPPRASPRSRLPSLEFQDRGTPKSRLVRKSELANAPTLLFVPPQSLIDKSSLSLTSFW